MTTTESAAIGFAVGAGIALGVGVAAYIAAKAALPVAVRAAVREQAPQIVAAIERDTQSIELTAIARTLTTAAVQEQLSQLIINIAQRSLP